MKSQVGGGRKITITALTGGNLILIFSLETLVTFFKALKLVTRLK